VMDWCVVAVEISQIGSVEWFVGAEDWWEERYILGMINFYCSVRFAECSDVISAVIGDVAYLVGAAQAVA